MAANEKPATHQVLDVETTYQQKARQPGGISRNAALARASEQLASLQSEFESWLMRESAMLMGLAAAFGAASPPELTEMLDRAATIASRLRDTGGTMGYPLLSEVCREFALALTGMRDGAPFRADAVACYIDAFALARSTEHRAKRASDLPQLAQALAALTNIVSPPIAADAPE